MATETTTPAFISLLREQALLLTILGPEEYWDDSDADFVLRLHNLDPDKSPARLAALIQREIDQRTERGEEIPQDFVRLVSDLNKMPPKKRPLQKPHVSYPNLGTLPPEVNPLRLLLLLIGREDDWDEASAELVLEIHHIDPNQPRDRLIEAVQKKIRKYKRQERPVPSALSTILVMLLDPKRDYWAYGLPEPADDE
jgi:hypothetical protein